MSPDEKEYYIGYDLGSSSIKIAIVDSLTGESIHRIHTPQEEMKIYSPQPGWAEQDPDLWWQYICTGTQRVIRESDIRAEQIKGIGISYQMHGLVIVDKK